MFPEVNFYFASIQMTKRTTKEQKHSQAIYW